MEELKKKSNVFSKVKEFFINIDKGFSYGIDEENPSLPRDNTKQIESLHIARIDDSLVSNKKNSEKKSTAYRKNLKAKVTPIIDEEQEIDEEQNIKIIE